MEVLLKKCGMHSHVQDKGYAWLVLFWSALSHSLHIGFIFAVVGNLTVAHQEFFNIDLQLGSMIGTVHTGAFFFFGPLASVLLKKFRCRATQIMGGCCVVLGYGLSALSSQPWHAFLLFGVLAGFGVSNLWMSSSQTLADHFSKYKRLAFSTATIGQHIGGTVWPVVTQSLLKSLGYSTAMGVFGAFHCLHIVAGLFYSPPPQAAAPDNDGNGVERKGAEGIQHSDIELKIQNDGKRPESDRIEGCSLVDEPEEIIDTGEPQMSIKDGFKILLTSPKVWIVLANAMLWSANSSTYYVFINDFIIAKTGLSKDEVALGVTILGVACIAGALLTTAISSLKFDRTILHCTCQFLFGVTTIGIAFSSGKVMYYMLSAVWGIMFGAFIANLLAFINSLCDANLLVFLFGLNFVAQTISTLGAAPLVGYVSATAGRQYGIILSGCCGVVSSLVLLPLVVHHAKQRKEAKPKQ